MKLPSSSSILFATLAISSSSSSLAAPTAPGDTSLTSSSSNHPLAFHRGSNLGHKPRGIRSPVTKLKRRSDRIVERRLGYPVLIDTPKAADIGGVLGRVVQVINSLVNALGLDVNAIGIPNVSGLSVDSLQGINQEDLDELKSAVEHLSNALANMPPSLQSIISGATPSNSSSTSSSMPSSSATPNAAAAVNGSAFPSNSTSAASSAPTGASPPVVAVPFAVAPDAPANATTPSANTPAAPVTPSLPVNPLAVSPPALPISPPVNPPSPPVNPPSPPVNSSANPANASTAATTPTPSA